jgi:hypothetical protein
MLCFLLISDKTFLKKPQYPRYLSLLTPERYRTLEYRSIAGISTIFIANTVAKYIQSSGFATKTLIAVKAVMTKATENA